MYGGWSASFAFAYSAPCSELARPIGSNGGVAMGSDGGATTTESRSDTPAPPTSRADRRHFAFGLDASAAFDDAEVSSLPHATA
jgi:hypothetical protein